MDGLEIDNKVDVVRTYLSLHLSDLGKRPRVEVLNWRNILADRAD